MCLIDVSTKRFKSCGQVKAFLEKTSKSSGQVKAFFEKTFKVVVKWKFFLKKRKKFLKLWISLFQDLLFDCNEELFRDIDIDLGFSDLYESIQDVEDNEDEEIANKVLTGLLEGIIFVVFKN